MGRKAKREWRYTSTEICCSKATIKHSTKYTQPVLLSRILGCTGASDVVMRCRPPLTTLCPHRTIINIHTNKVRFAGSWL